MEGISVSVCKGLKECWRRRGYQRLNGSGRRRRTARVELGATTRTRKTRLSWGWRIKVAPKIRIRRIPSPKKMLLWVRDSYVRMMLGLANTRVMTMNASGMGFGGPHPVAMGGLGRTQPQANKEYDEKVIVQIYKSLLMTHGQLLPSETARIASEIRCRRSL